MRVKLIPVCLIIAAILIFSLNSLGIAADEPIYCNNCGGSGQSTCPWCNGAGYPTCDSCFGTGEVDMTCGDCNGRNVYCSSCYGTGRTYVRCNNCGGSGSSACVSCGGSGTTTCVDCGGRGLIY